MLWWVLWWSISMWMVVFAKGKSISRMYLFQGGQIFASFFLEGDQGNQPKVIRLASWSTRAHCWLLLLGSWELSNGDSKICLGGPLYNQLDAAIDTLKTSLWRKHWKKKKSIGKALGKKGWLSSDILRMLSCLPYHWEPLQWCSFVAIHMGYKYFMGLPWWLSGKESACNAGDIGDASLILG